MIQIFKKAVLGLILIGSLATTGYSRYSEEGDASLRAFGTSIIGKYKSTPDFFSNPRGAYSTWNSEYQAQSGKRGQNITALQIFETMGISARGILNSTDRKLDGVARAEMDGNFQIASGNAFGIRRENATPAEERIIVRELLNMGHFAAQTRMLDRQINALETKYRAAGQAYERQHLQMCALFLRAGARQALPMGGWYLEKLDRSAVDSKIRQYTNQPNLMPTQEGVAAASSGFGSKPPLQKPTAAPSGFTPSPPPVPTVKPVADVRFDPNEIVLKHLDPRSFLYGTDDVHPSKIHADAAGARFLNVPGLGTLKTPSNAQSVDSVCSIAVNVGHDHYIAITSTHDLKGEDDRFVFLPAYGEIEPERVLKKKFVINRMQPEVLEGNVSVSLTSKFLPPLTPRTIKWSTVYEDNLILDPPTTPEAFSFITTVTGRDGKQKTFYHLRVQKSTQITLRTFSQGKGVFTLHQLLEELESDLKDSPVLAELAQIKAGNFPKI
jgi:hypothetical protein